MRKVEKGQRVRIDANVADDQGSVRGARGVVIGPGSKHAERGHVDVRLPSGEVIGVDRKALKAED